jgi:hypothetical protein
LLAATGHLYPWWLAATGRTVTTPAHPYPWWPVTGHPYLWWGGGTTLPVSAGWSLTALLASLAGAAVLLPLAPAGPPRSQAPGTPRGSGVLRAHVVPVLAGAAVLALPEAVPAGRAAWWWPAAVGTAGMVVAGVLAVLDRHRGRAATAALTGGLLGLLAAGQSLYRAPATEVVLGVVVLTAVLLCFLGARHGTPSHAPIVVGAAVAGGLLALPGAVAAGAAAAGAGTAGVWVTAVLASLAGLVATAFLRLSLHTRLSLPDTPPAVAAGRRWVVLPWAVGGTGAGTWVVAAVGVAAVRPVLPVALVCAVVGLLGVVGGLLLLPRRDAALTGVLVGGGSAVVVALLLAVPVLRVLLVQLTWLGAVWAGHPAGTVTGLVPGGYVPPYWWPAEADRPLPGAVGGLLVVAVALGVAGRRFAGRALPVLVGPPVCAALLLIPVWLDLPWPAEPALALAIAAVAALPAAGILTAGTPPHGVSAAGPASGGGGVAPAGRLSVAAAGSSGAAGRPGGVAGGAWRHGVVRGVSVGVCVGVGVLGVAGALAVRGTTVAALAVVVAVGLLAGVRGDRGGRLGGWVAVVVGAVLEAVGAGRVAGLAVAACGLAVVAVAVLLLGLGAVLPGRWRGERVVVEVGSYLGAGLAVVLAAGSTRELVIVLSGYGAALGLSALRPGRRWLAVLAAACELAAWWLLLRDAAVGVVEAYTLPVALVALLGGLLVSRRRSQRVPDDGEPPGVVSSWLAYGPALLAALAPSLALVLATGGGSWRRLLLGTGALAVLVVGALWRRQAPVVTGGVVVLVVAVHEVVLSWDLVPRWIPLGTAGLILVLLGATFERRRRDLRRLRGALGRMR